ncbi:MAG: hypothetical protein B6I17_04555 [Tenericutes bacterium 4572_104]|nr:MAG: hypothetical protein B6I17_04555 [Tenericutes bacterium 4572_104]
MFDFKKYDIIASEIAEIVPDQYYHFFTEGRWSFHELLLYLLSFSGPAKVSITSFSISEVTLRTFLSAIELGHITNLELILNTSVTRNKTALLFFANNIVKKIGLSRNHMKLILIENDKFKIVVNQSANATPNNSEETGVICTHKKIYEIYNRKFNQLLDNSIIFENDIITRSIK